MPCILACVLLSELQPRRCDTVSNCFVLCWLKRWFVCIRRFHRAVVQEKLLARVASFAVAYHESISVSHIGQEVRSPLHCGFVSPFISII